MALTFRNLLAAIMNYSCLINPTNLQTNTSMTIRLALLTPHDNYDSCCPPQRCHGDVSTCQAEIRQPDLSQLHQQICLSQGFVSLQINITWLALIQPLYTHVFYGVRLAIFYDPKWLLADQWRFHLLLWHRQRGDDSNWE